MVVIRDYESLLLAGTAAQMEKLVKNAHKKGFDDIDLPYATGRLLQEVQELQEANAYEDIRHEAADIANFAHMIIYKCDKLIEDKTVPMSLNVFERKAAAWDAFEARLKELEEYDANKHALSKTRKMVNEAWLKAGVGNE